MDRENCRRLRLWQFAGQSPTRYVLWTGTMNQLSSYFNNASRMLQARSDLSAASGHQGDNGSNREMALLDFLNDHLPDRLRAIRGGKALGLGQTPSRQIDIFVKNDLAPKYELNEKSFVLCETVAASISVKTCVDKSSIFDSLENIASIPQNSEGALRFKVVKPQARTDYNKHFPVLVAFGFRGIDGETALGHINDFYSANPGIPENRRLDMLIVNGRYEINVSDKPRKVTGGGSVLPGVYHWANTADEKCGVPLAALINRVSSHLSWLPFMDFNFHEYVNEAYALAGT